MIDDAYGRDERDRDFDGCRRCGEARCYCECWIYDEPREEDGTWPDPEAATKCHRDAPGTCSRSLRVESGRLSAALAARMRRE